MTDSIQFHGGWTPELHSADDRSLAHPEIQSLTKLLGLHEGSGADVPASADLRSWCSPVHYQGPYNTCQAHVVAGMLELIENRAFGAFVPASRLFLYQVTRRLLREEGDPGIYIRQMLGALAFLGVPPEKYWPYLDTKHAGDPRLEVEPDAFCFAMARDFGTLRHYRLDPEGCPRETTLYQIRAHVAAGLPTSLGFPMYEDALTQALGTSGRIPFARADRLIGNHAVLVVGYDDSLSVENKTEKAVVTEGAFLVKNSWSEAWGDKGYGWLPYQYLLEGHAKDCWTMLQPKWIESNRFGLELEPQAAPTGRVEARAAADRSANDAE